MTATAAPPVRPNRATRRARGKGSDVRLADGRTVQVRYGMAGLAELEDCFGSIGAVQDVLRELDIQRPLFSPLLKLLACGMVQAQLLEVGDDELPTWQQVRAVLARDELIVPSRLQEHYLPAVVEAIDQAFPAAPASPGNRRTTGSATPRSRGTAGGTKPSSSSGAAPASSGA